MDYALFKLINNFAGQSYWLDTLAIFFAAYWQYILGAGVVIFMLARRDAAQRLKNFKITALAFGAAIVSRFLFCQPLKILIARPRPEETFGVTQLIPHDSFGSFPSGHMSFFFALATVIYLFFKKVYPERSRGAGAVLFVSSFLIGLARIYVGIHFPLDILGGIVLGVLVGWGSWKFFSKRV